MRLVPQASLYEATIENAELELALDEPQRAKEAAGRARKTYAERHDRAKALIDQLDLGDGAPVRVGRFLVTRSAVAGRAVSFETGPSTRLTISPIEEMP